jgi:surface protein
VSTDATNWTGTDSPAQQLASNAGQSYFMWDSEFGSNGFITIGLKNAIIHSTDNGQNYNIINHQFNNQNDNLFSIAYGGNKYVAVGRPGVIISSANGTSWTTQTSGYEVQSSGSTGLSAVTYGENKYVVFGNRGGNDPGVICLTSSDAITWTSELISTGDYDVYDLTHKSIPYAGSQSSTTTSCTVSGSLTSAVGSDSQTVSMSTAITNIEYTLTTTCSDTLSAAIAWTPSTPNGVSMSFSNNVATISGTPTGTATGTYNYTLTASNTAGTASTTFNGSLTLTDNVSSSSSSSTTTSCTIIGSLTSANGSDSQTVSMSTAITSIEYTLTTTCSDTLNAAITWTPSTPNGVSMSFSNNVATISGTPTGTATGTYNYTLTASNTAGTASASFSGSLTVSSLTVSISSGSSVTSLSDIKTGSDVSGQNLIAFDGSTLKCANAQVGDYATINGKEYIVVNNQSLNDLKSGSNIDYTCLCTSKVTDMSEVFRDKSDFNQDIGAWDTSSVTDMSFMFSDAEAFDQNIGGWVTSNVTDMSWMFADMGWSTGQITTQFNQDISGWDVSSVVNMKGMFSNNEKFNQDISGWDVSNVTNMFQMFKGDKYNDYVVGSAFNQDISGWDVSSVSDMSGMFYGNSAFNQDISSWDVSSVVNMSGMFGGLNNYSIFNQNIGGWDVSNVTNMSQMFQYNISFNQDIGSWDVSSVVNMREMFYSSAAFNQDIGNWDVSNVTDMTRMFGKSNVNPNNLTFNQDLTNWCVINVNQRAGFDANSNFNQSNHPVWGRCPDTFSIDVTATSSSDYTLSGSDRNGNVSGSDPNLTFNVGDTINFVVNASGHPFYLKTAAGTGTGDTISGVTNNGSESATISWTPTATGTYYYQCSLHGGMVGTITIQ